MAQFSLAGLTEQSTEIKALKRGLEKGTGQSIVSVELDKKLKKIDDAVTRGVSLFFEQGQSLYIVFRKNGDQIQVKQNGKQIPFSGQLNYGNSVKLFNASVEELAENIRAYQQKFDKLQARKNLKQIDGMVAKTEKQRKIAVSTQIKQLTALSSQLDQEIAEITQQNRLLEQEVEQLEQQAKQTEQTVVEADDKPIELTGDEFGEFDLSSSDGVKALRENVNSYLNNLRGQFVFCKALNADVEIRKQGIKKFMSFTSNPVKLQLAHSILDIIKNGKVFKPSQSSYADNELNYGVKYHYLKTKVTVNNTEYGARIVIREDSNGKFHYDLQVKDSIENIFDNIKQNPNVPNINQALAVSDFAENILNQDDDESQAFSDDFMFDSANSRNGYVLNLFVFDENGNEIDEYPQRNEADDIKAQYKTRLANKDVTWLEEHSRQLEDMFSQRISEVKKHLRKVGFVDDGENRMEINAPAYALVHIDGYADFGWWTTYNIDVDGNQGIQDLLDTTPQQLAKQIFDHYHMLVQANVQAQDGNELGGETNTNTSDDENVSADGSTGQVEPSKDTANKKITAKDVIREIAKSGKWLKGEFISTSSSRREFIYFESWVGMSIDRYMIGELSDNQIYYTTAYDGDWKELDFRYRQSKLSKLKKLLETNERRTAPSKIVKINKNDTIELVVDTIKGLIQRSRYNSYELDKFIGHFHNENGDMKDFLQYGFEFDSNKREVKRLTQNGTYSVYAEHDSLIGKIYVYVIETGKRFNRLEEAEFIDFKQAIEQAIAWLAKYDVLDKDIVSDEPNQSIQRDKFRYSPKERALEIDGIEFDFTTTGVEFLVFGVAENEKSESLLVELLNHNKMKTTGQAERVADVMTQVYGATNVRIHPIAVSKEGVKEVKSPVGSGVIDTQETQTDEQNQAVNADVQYLQDVADGKIDVFADDFDDKFTAIVEKLDDDYPDLTKKAVDYYIAKTDEYALATE